MRLMHNNSIPTLVLLLAGCNAGDVVPPPTEKETEGGYGDGTGSNTDSGNTEDGTPDECWYKDAPEGAVRWQCEGLAEASIFFTLDVEVPDWVEGAEALQQIIDYGRLDGAALFGPWNPGEAYDDPGVDACCLPSISGDEEEGLDETGADPSDGEEAVPQAAMACAEDCADQACRMIPGQLRALAAQIPAGIPVLGPSYRDQLKDLANWVAQHQQDCWEAMIMDGVDAAYGRYSIDGEWQIPNDGNWPVITDLSVKGECKVYDWYLPEDGEPLACTGINDNNDEVEFGGGSLGGFDTFAPTGGEMRLDGPVIFGVPATGMSPILGLGDQCPRGECSRLDATINKDVLELRHLVMVAPSAMTWEREGMLLTLDGLHAQVEHAMSIPLVTNGSSMQFEIPAGKLEMLFAGRVHGVPVKVEVPNVTPVTGTVFPLFDGSHGIVIDPFTVEHRDAFGTWSMTVELGELVAVDHAPRATFEVQTDGSTQRVDASASFDPDGDGLSYEWFRDGVQIGEGPVAESDPATDGDAPLTLRVTDETGRATWSNGLSAEGN